MIKKFILISLKNYVHTSINKSFDTRNAHEKQLLAESCYILQQKAYILTIVFFQVSNFLLIKYFIKEIRKRLFKDFYFRNLESPGKKIFSNLKG